MTSSEYKNTVQWTLATQPPTDEEDILTTARRIFKNLGVPFPLGSISDAVRVLSSGDYMGWTAYSEEQALLCANNGYTAVGVTEDRIVIIMPEDETVAVGTALPEVWHPVARKLSEMSGEEVGAMRFFAFAMLVENSAPVQAGEAGEGEGMMVAAPAATTCTTGCQVACQTGCQVSCQSCNTCQTGCQVSCNTGCQVNCQTGCQVSCNTGCQVVCNTGCQVNCQSCNTCQTGCQVNCQSCNTCQTGCQVNCQSCNTCQTGCQVNCQSCNTCQTGCQVNCQSCNTCQTGCQVNCQSCNTCQTGCQVVCNTGCQVSCQTCNTCQSGCEVSCMTCNACQSGCEVSCMTCDTCQSGCEVVCNTGCQVTCNTGCQVTCNSCNTCQSGCEVSCMTCDTCQSCNTCQSGGEVAIPVDSVSVSPTSKTIGVNESFTITPTVLPANASNKNVTWSSSSPAATVSGGVVTGQSAGSATITCTTVDGDKKASCAVNVTTYIQPPKPSNAGLPNISTLFFPIHQLETLYATYFINTYGYLPEAPIVKGLIATAVTSYLRKNKYSTGEWPIITGRTISPDFVQYVQTEAPSLFNLLEIYISGDQNDLADTVNGIIDLAHLAATLECYLDSNISLVGHAYFAGWGADVASCTYDVINSSTYLQRLTGDFTLLAYEKVGAAISHCNYSDLCCDSDAIKISEIIKNQDENYHPLSTAMETYYNIYVNSRMEYFLDDLNCSPTLSSINAKVRDKMFGVIDNTVWQKGTDEYDGIKLAADVLDKLRKSVCDAFAQYVYSEIS